MKFFQALNPLSENSGIKYCLIKSGGRLLPVGERIQSAHTYKSQKRVFSNGVEMQDELTTQVIKDFWQQNLNFGSGIAATYESIVGHHYDFSLYGIGAKGALDFLILPLLARKLLADAYLPERKENTVANVAANIFAWVVALPLEIARFSVGIALTLALIPVVALVHAARFCLHKLSTDNREHAEIREPAVVVTQTVTEGETQTDTEEEEEEEEEVVASSPKS